MDQRGRSTSFGSSGKGWTYIRNEWVLAGKKDRRRLRTVTAPSG